MELSVILTCLNQEKVLEKSVERIRQVLNSTKINYEIVIVDDGSTDSTYNIMQRLSKKYKNINLFKHPHNIGRGRAVTNGFKTAKGEFIGYLDTDLELPPEYIPMFLEELKKGNDVVTYLRRYKLNLQGIMRTFTSYSYHILVRLLLNVKLRDTETGFKFFRKEKIINTLDEIKSDKWFWDTEIMVRSYLKNLRIREIPLIYTPNKEGGSTVKIFSDSLDYLKNLIKFRREVNKIRKLNLA